MLCKGLHSETDFIWWRRCLYPVSSTIWNQCSGRWTISMYRLCTWINWNMRCSCDAYKSRSCLYKLLNSPASFTNWSQLPSCFLLSFSALCLPVTQPSLTHSLWCLIHFGSLTEIISFVFSKQWSQLRNHGKCCVTATNRECIWIFFLT